MLREEELADKYKLKLFDRIFYCPQCGSLLHCDFPYGNEKFATTDPSEQVIRNKALQILAPQISGTRRNRTKFAYVYCTQVGFRFEDCKFTIVVDPRDLEGYDRYLIFRGR
jgi:hypothetical protein